MMYSRNPYQRFTSEGDKYTNGKTIKVCVCILCVETLQSIQPKLVGAEADVLEIPQGPPGSSVNKVFLKRLPRRFQLRHSKSMRRMKMLL
jgi:hypothetical protein